MQKLRFGIIGAGGIAAHFANAVRISEVAEVVGVSSKSPERAVEFANKNNIVKAYSSYEELVKSPDINAVYIATTHNYHYENIMLCLSNGKHVVCEKPMTLTEKEAKNLFDFAKEKNLFLMEAMWSRFLPSIQQAKKWILDGKIGKVTSVSATIGFKSTRNPESRLLNPALAGGAMYDIGVYPIEIVSYLVGEPIIDIVGVTRKAPETGVDENNTFILRYNSCDAAIQCMFTSNAKEYIVVQGENGFIDIPSANVGDECFLHNNRRERTEAFKEPHPGGNGFVYEIRHVVSCILNGKITSDVMPPEATIECARVFDKLLNH